MGLEERDGQNGYLPDASTSSFDVAAVPSDTSYDRDPEARMTVAPCAPSRSSNTATCQITCTGFAPHTCVLALCSVCSDAPTNLCAWLRTAPSVPVFALLQYGPSVKHKAKVSCFAYRCGTYPQLRCRCGTWWWWALALLAAHSPSRRARCISSECFMLLQNLAHC